MFLTSFILTLRPAVLAKLVILGTSFLTSFFLALTLVLVAKLLISSILFLILALYIYFLTRSVFTTSPSLLKSTGTGTNFWCNLSTLLLKCLIQLILFFVLYQYVIYQLQILSVANQAF